MHTPSTSKRLPGPLSSGFTESDSLGRNLSFSAHLLYDRGQVIDAPVPRFPRLQNGDHADASLQDYGEGQKGRCRARQIHRPSLYMRHGPLSVSVVNLLPLLRLWFMSKFLRYRVFWSMKVVQETNLGFHLGRRMEESQFRS